MKTVISFVISALGIGLCHCALWADEVRPSTSAPAPVSCLAFHPGGKVIVVGGFTKIRVFDAASGDEIQERGGQTAHVTAVAFDKAGKRLAVASGEPGKSGEVRVYAVGADGLPGSQPEKLLLGHKDVIYGMDFSPDGASLATCGYDRLIKIFDVASAKEVLELKDHSDAVYAVAYSPDGRMLASGSADRTVKIWEPKTGKRLHTLSDSTDWIYTLAWNPQSNRVAAGGVDKAIRVWQVSPESAKLVAAAFAHERSLLRLLYASHGKSLYSLGEDRVLKAWNADTLVERTVYPKQTVQTLSVAISPDGKHLAVGRFDGSADLLEESTGKVALTLLPTRPKPPQITGVTPAIVQRGILSHLVIEGKSLDSVTELNVNYSNVITRILSTNRSKTRLEAEITFPATTSAGVYQLTAKSGDGVSQAFAMTVDCFTAVTKREPNNSPKLGQPITLPVTIAGDLNKAGDVDFYRFEAQKNQELGVHVLSGVMGSQLEPVLTLLDSRGRMLVESSSGSLGFTFPEAGFYALGIRDREYRGGKMPYRLNAGPIPVVTSLFPIGIERGREVDIHVEGVFLDGVKSVHVSVPAGAAPESQFPLTFNTTHGVPLGRLQVVVGEFPEVSKLDPVAKEGALPVPGTANGSLGEKQARDVWRFKAKKGERLVLEVNARRLGSPLDSFIEIRDRDDQAVPQAVLRSISRTNTVFRDHDSAGAGIRMESWNDLVVNDYIYTGNELIRIFSLPRNPDDDCIYYTVRGQREGFLGTTPGYLSLGSPMYKVSIHPPGSKFPPNGLPVVTLYYRNDDGGPGFGKDSRIVFDPPADGEYKVVVGDARGQGGPGYFYRLTVRPPRPSYSVSFNPSAPVVRQGSSVPVTVEVTRIDEFDGPIEVTLENLPPGFSAPKTIVPAGEVSTSFALFADAKAAPVDEKKQPHLTLVAKAQIQGKAVNRTVPGGVPKMEPAGDIITTTDQTALTIKPGEEVRLTVHIERRNGFKGRVPVEVKGLPHGVHVLDVGLNGILVTERDSSRTMVIRAEPWVQPIEHPFVIFANYEAKGTQHGAPSVLLRVVK